MTNPYEAANAFITTFRETEYALKRGGYRRKNKSVAEADWDAFATALGQEFFDCVVEAGIAKTLIGEPPRRLLENMQWSPVVPVPLTNTIELVVQGVCRVRNSYIHGEKFTGGPEGQWERDHILVTEAHMVLVAAVEHWFIAK